jgi:hypothetical protein
MIFTTIKRFITITLLLSIASAFDSACDSMPGNWSSYWSNGAPSGDHFLVFWAPERGIGAFNISLLSS